MLTDDLKSDIERLSTEDKRELSLFMVKLQLENDESYLKTIRERIESYYLDNCVAVSDL